MIRVVMTLTCIYKMFVLYKEIKFNQIIIFVLLRSKESAFLITSQIQSAWKKYTKQRHLVTKLERHKIDAFWIMVEKALRSLYLNAVIDQTYLK